MVHVVEVRNSLSKLLDTGRGAVLSSGHGDVNDIGSLEATGNIIFDFGGALAKIGPGLGVLEEAILGSALSAPNDTSGRSAGIETGMGLMTLVGVTELAMDLGLEFWRRALLVEDSAQKLNRVEYELQRWKSIRESSR